MLAVTLLAGLCYFACDRDLFKPGPKSESDNLGASSVHLTGGCIDKKNKQKKEAEIAAMTPRQLFDEHVKVDVYHDDFESYQAFADYLILIERHFRKSGIAALAPLIDALNDYSPEVADLCAETRVSLAIRLSRDIDKHEFRLRATKDGLLVVEAMEKAIERMKTAKDRRVVSLVKDYTFIYLDPIRGINATDLAIRDTLWRSNGIEMSDDELLQFVNYLVSKDNTYPSWTPFEFLADCKINPNGFPKQCFIKQDPKRYYDTYLEFKKSKRVSSIGT
jgi:hypothetical protein